MAPRVLADGPLAENVAEMLRDKVELLPWEAAARGTMLAVEGIYTYGHPQVNAGLLDHLVGVKVISNYGVGVDHIDLTAARERGIPVGNTPGILDGATADMAFALLLAAARRVVSGDRYARSSEFLRYDPGCMLGTEVHGQTLGIVGMGRIGAEVARRALGFNMRVLYHNRNVHPHEQTLSAKRVPLEELLSMSDFVVITVPLSEETRNLIGSEQLQRMKPSAILVNVARGPVVNTEAITAALQQGIIYGAALDVTDPEPLPRDHPLLACENLTIAPHLGSATVQTRQKMAELSVQNLLLGLAGEPLLHRVK